MLRDADFMRGALRLARRGYGTTSPNPMVGAILVKGGNAIGHGWHHRAGEAHAEIEALSDARKKGVNVRGATLYVTLEPCSTHGRTPPCTEAIIAAGIKRVVAGATDPNPRHSGNAFAILRRADIAVAHGILEKECADLNEAFNHWIVHRTPFVTVKAAMTFDGKIATATGESKWITGARARAYAMNLRRGNDAILVGINTVLSDNPSLTVRGPAKAGGPKQLRRIVLDSRARTPLKANVVSDEFAPITTIVVGRHAPKQRVAPLAKRVEVLIAPSSPNASDTEQVSLKWLLKKLGSRNIVSVLVEGGGEVNASFLLHGLAHRVAFFFAPKIIGGRASRPAVAGSGISSLQRAPRLNDIRWQRLGDDLLLTGRVRATWGRDTF